MSTKQRKSKQLKAHQMITKQLEFIAQKSNQFLLLTDLKLVLCGLNLKVDLFKSNVEVLSPEGQRLFYAYSDFKGRYPDFTRLIAYIQANPPREINR